METKPYYSMRLEDACLIEGTELDLSAVESGINKYCLIYIVVYFFACIFDICLTSFVFTSSLKQIKQYPDFIAVVIILALIAVLVFCILGFYHFAQQNSGNTVLHL